LTINGKNYGKNYAVVGVTMAMVYVAAERNKKEIYIDEPRKAKFI